MSDKELEAYILEWLNWCYTRKFYVPMGAQNILARMQPSKTGLPPNARNSADMQWFNAAVHALGDMKDHAEAFACFKLLYIEERAQVKVEAGKLGISRVTFYNRAKAFARKAISLGQSLKTAYENMQVEEVVAVD